jgi:NAD(P)-dependent dehydrogenase (short-subunit alcohol dehydrogenase family)
MSVAIVTGASRGLGRALAMALADTGWVVVVDGRSLADDPPPGTVAVPGDIAEPEHRAALIEAARWHGGIDLLVNNAGILGPSPQPPLAEYPHGPLLDVFEINVFAPLALTQLALPSLRLRAGAVVNVSSDAAVEAYPGWGVYGAAKAAVEHISRVLAEEEPDVHVWCVDPGDLRTQMHQEAFPGQDISDRPLPETVVPPFLRLLADRPKSGRIRLADLVVPA